MRVPDHDSVVAVIQSKVQEALAKVPRDRVQSVVQGHGVSYGMLYKISRWDPCFDQSFNFRKLLDAYDCACDLLEQGHQTGDTTWK